MSNSELALLIVDDEEMNRDMLSRRLQRLGYRVLLACDGRQALEQIAQHDVALVLLDVMMPGMDGLEVLTNIRETHSLVELPVIMATARDQSGDVVAALQLGANDYVTKPINFPVILARIQTQLAMRTARVDKQIVAQRAAVATMTGEAGGTRSQSGFVRSNSPAQESDRLSIGDYEVLGELGRGGMGVVYKARHQRMNRIAALKVINREHLTHPDAVRRFYQEIQAAAQLTHPNVVIAYDAGQTDDTHYFAMEYVEGIDLSRLLQQSGPLRIGQACDYIRQAALGLQHAHEKGLVHRDVKPSNLLVTQSVEPSNSGLTPIPSGGVVKVLDLGLALIHQPADVASAAKELTRDGRVVGTIDYMAPEQWKNAHKVDIRSDLYSLGCTMYHLLTGSVPFPGAEGMEKMLKHHLDEPTPVERLRLETPAKVAGLIRRLMAKNPEQRYQTPAELAELLRWYAQEFRGL